jgi:NADH dehydrogenase [ubiquinone] 1 alpha subcomplex assembly factor 7
MKAKDTIISRIKQLGYLPIDQFMKLALSDCKDSYYRNKDPIGKNKDFITAPETSQMFGEIIGFWVIEKWMEMGSPSKINLIELGPGNGTLLYNLLRVTKNIIGLNESLEIYMVEINEHLKIVQKQTLDPMNLRIYWVEELNKIQNYPTIVIGNEFFDSLPIKQYIFIENSWRERVVIINIKGELDYSVIDIDNLHILDYLNQYKSVKNNSIIEFSQESKNYINLLQEILCQNKFNCLFIDYGYNISPIIRKSNQYNSTLQAINKHQYCNIFHDIGNSDLTSHVDFDMLLNCINKDYFDNSFISSQKEFLIKYGIEQRLLLLSRDKNPELKQILFNQYKRLTDKNEMGELFKVMEIWN